MKRDVRDNRSDISLLQPDSVFVHDRLAQLERQADRLDAASIKKNPSSSEFLNQRRETTYLTWKNWLQR